LGAEKGDLNGERVKTSDRETTYRRHSYPEKKKGGGKNKRERLMTTGWRAYGVKMESQ